METVRHIVDSSLLDKISLPPNFKNKRVEITIRLIDDNDKSVDVFSDDELLEVSDFLMEQNKETYEVLAK